MKDMIAWDSKHTDDFLILAYLKTPEQLLLQASKACAIDWIYSVRLSNFCLCSLLVVVDEVTGDEAISRQCCADGLEK